MSKITVDVEELISRLNEVLEEGYVAVQLIIDDSNYEKELHVCASGMELDEPIDYGRICELTDELL